MDGETEAPAGPLLPRRIGRFSYAVLTVACLASALILGVSEETARQAASLLLGLVVLVLTALRLRDIGRSGWWTLLLFVPVVHLIAIVALSFWPGTHGENRRPS